MEESVTYYKGQLADKYFSTELSISQQLGYFFCEYYCYAPKSKRDLDQALVFKCSLHFETSGTFTVGQIVEIGFLEVWTNLNERSEQGEC